MRVDVSQKDGLESLQRSRPASEKRHQPTGRRDFGQHVLDDNGYGKVTNCPRNARADGVSRR
jgi:hypothetical protein